MKWTTVSPRGCGRAQLYFLGHIWGSFLHSHAPGGGPRAWGQCISWTVVHRALSGSQGNTLTYLQTHRDFHSTEKNISLWLKMILRTTITAYVRPSTQGWYFCTNLEQDKYEEQLVDDANAKPKPPVSYGRKKKCIGDGFRIKEYIRVNHFVN